MPRFFELAPGSCVPKSGQLMLAARNAVIWRDANQGMPMAELVRRYGLTERQVWAVLVKGVNTGSRG